MNFIKFWHYICEWSMGKYRQLNAIMKIKLLITVAVITAATSIRAQETPMEKFLVKGRIINELGDAVEYVQVGIPKYDIGTISKADGTFEIEVPADTLEFHHVSYRTGLQPVSGPEKEMVIIMESEELEPAVFNASDTKEKYLIRPGRKILGNYGVISFQAQPKNNGIIEMGSKASVKKPFLVQKIRFTINSNQIPGCVASINIYRIEGDEFINILHKPKYFDIPVSDTSRTFELQPDEPVLLEPGKYFVSFMVVDYDEVDEPKEMTASLHLKSSYMRRSVLGKFNHIPVNIGVAVKGLEYR